MRVYIDDKEYQGTPDEIEHFLYLREARYTTKAIEPDFTPDDFQPFDEVVTDSENLRKKLAENPDFNPYGGVVPSQEGDSETASTALNAPFTAEENTGVVIK